MDYVKSKSRSSIQGFLVALAALLMLSIGMVGLAGCSGGTSDEEAIRASLASELDSIKNIDDAFVNEFSESIDMSQLSVYGIDGVEFMKSYLSGFDYAIRRSRCSCRSLQRRDQPEDRRDRHRLPRRRRAGGHPAHHHHLHQGRRNLGAGLVHLGRHRGRADDQLNTPSTRKPLEGRSIGAPFFYNAR